MKPHLKTAIIDGELQHVLITNGEAYQRFSSLRAALCALAFAMALAGCATMEKHPVATWVAAGVIAGSIAASTNHRTPNARGDDLCQPPLSCK